MKIATQQKAILGVALVAVVVLVLTTAFSGLGGSTPAKPSGTTKKPADTAALAVVDFAQYYKDNKIDPFASAVLMNELIDEKAVDAKVRQLIGADRPVEVPKIADTQLPPTGENTDKAVSDYVVWVSRRLEDFNSATALLIPSVLAAEPERTAADKAASLASSLVQDLRRQPAPSRTKELVRSVLSVYTGMAEMFAAARQAGSPQEPAHWKRINDVYETYRIQALAQKELIRKLRPMVSRGSGIRAPGQALGRQWVKTAQAFLPAPTPVIIIEDIPRREEAVTRDIVGSVIQTASQIALEYFLDDTEQKLLISNYLYYNDALKTKYGRDYVDKYLPDKTDREIVLRLMSQISCNRLDEAQFKKLMQAQALKYLGFDPAQLDPKDPDFYEKMLRTFSQQGDPTGEGYRKYYQSLALVAEGVAEESAKKELANPGRKVPTDTTGKHIQQSLDSFSGKQQAGVDALFSFLPTNATTGFFGLPGLMKNMLTAILKKFAVKGVILQEQKACVDLPVLNPVAAGDFSPNRASSPADIQKCITGGVAECSGALFQTTVDPDELLGPCNGPKKNDYGETVFGHDLSVLASPGAAKIGTPISLTYSVRPKCLRDVLNLSEGPNLNMIVYGGDEVPTNVCSVPVDEQDPNKTLTIVPQPFATQHAGSVSVDSGKIAHRYRTNGAGQYLRDSSGNLIPAKKTGKQSVVLVMYNSKGLCVTGKADVYLE